MADNQTSTRIFLSVFGATSGAALWGLGELADRVDPGRVWLALFTFVLVGAASVLLLAGPLGRRQGLFGGAALGLAVAALMSAGALRFEGIDGFLRDAHPFFAIFGITLIALPFVITTLREDEVWTDYDALFTHAWQLVVRAIVAFAFLGAVWLLMLLSSAVLEIVGIEILKRLMRQDAFGFTLSGGVLGLGAAILYELRDTIRPALVLRLLRVMLPPVLVVAVLFLFGVVAQMNGPLRGLFGALSPSAVLMMLGFVAASLVTTAIDTKDERGVQGMGMLWMARAMALILPVLAGVAFYGVTVRVGAFGWTPDRLVAITIAALLLGYGLVYAAALLRGTGWRAGVRQGNVTMALVVLGVTALWFTPVLNPQNISTKSQIARFDAGKTEITEMPFFEMAQRWGKPGVRGLARLEASGDAAVIERIALARQAQTRFQAKAAVTTTQRAEYEGVIMENAIVHGLEGALPDGFLASMNDRRLEQFAKGCIPLATEGCAVIVAQTEQAGQVVFMFLRYGDNARFISAFTRSDGGWQRIRTQQLSRQNAATLALDWAPIAQGTFRVGPARGSVLDVDGWQFFPNN